MCSLYSTDQVYTHVIHTLFMNIIGSSEEYCYDSIKPHVYYYGANIIQTVEPPNNGHIGDEHFVHCSDVVPSSEVEMYGQLMAGASSLSIVGRLSSYWSVHYRKFTVFRACTVHDIPTWLKNQS